MSNKQTKKIKNFFQLKLNKSFKYFISLSRDIMDYQAYLPNINNIEPLIAKNKVENNNTNEIISNTEFNEYIALLRQKQDSKYLEAREAKVEELVKKQLNEFLEDLSEPTNIYNVKLITTDNIKILAYHIFAQLADQIFLKRYVDSGLLVVNSLKKKIGRPRKEKLKITKRARGRPKKGLNHLQVEELSDFVNYHFDKEAYLFVNHFINQFKKTKLENKIKK